MVSIRRHHGDKDKTAGELLQHKKSILILADERETFCEVLRLEIVHYLPHVVVCVESLRSLLSVHLVLEVGVIKAVDQFDHDPGELRSGDEDPVGIVGVSSLNDLLIEVTNLDEADKIVLDPCPNLDLVRITEVLHCAVKTVFCKDPHGIIVTRFKENLHWMQCRNI